MIDTSRNLPLSLLLQKQYQALDGYFQKQKQQWQSGAIDDDALRDCYALLSREYVYKVLLLEDWLTAMPSSYAAHAALFNWWRAVGLEARGQDVAANVSQAGWQGMNDAMLKADHYARASLPLDDQPFEAYCTIGDIDLMLGQSDVDVSAGLWPDWYREGLARVPKSFSIRREMMWCLRPEWGGSIESLSAYVAMEPDSAMRYRMEGVMHRFLGHYQSSFQSDFSAAMKHFNMAKQINPGSAWNDYWIGLANWHHDRRDESIRVLRQAVAAAPDDMDMLGTLYNFLNWMDREQDVIDLLRNHTDTGSWRVYHRLGVAYRTLAIKQKSKPMAAEAVRYLQAAWLQGYPSSGNMLADIYQREELGQRDPVRAIEVARESAALGDAYSALMLWKSYRDEENLVTQSEALSALAHACSAGNVYASGQAAEAIESG
jgi:Domain of unknown function (DUF4034)